jgi:hypothetical protein
MIRGLGERKNSVDSAKAESGGWAQENMSQVKFAGDIAKAEAPMKSSSQMAAENRARQERMAQLRAEMLQQMKSVDAASNELNRTVNRKVEQMGGGAVKLDTGTQAPQKKGLFARFGRR